MNGTTEKSRPKKSDQVKPSRKRKRQSTVENGIDDKAEEYEVETIVDHSSETDPNSTNYQRILYRVKWKDWKDEYNTWEPIDNLKNSLETVVKYYGNLTGIITEIESQISAFKALVIDNITLDDIHSLASRYIRADGDRFPEITEAEVDNQMSLVAQLPIMARDPKLVQELKKQYTILEVMKRRQKQLLNLKAWESEINRQATGDSAALSVVNGVDLDCRPLDFKYINSSLLTNLDGSVHLSAIIGCKCVDCSGRCECARRDGSSRGYSGERLLKAPKGLAVYECTKLCTCGPNCTNRVLQLGRTISLRIFKTGNGRGWGVSTLSEINKGQFVTEYVGEIITREQSESRGRTYMKQGRTYLFDLDFCGPDFKYVIDAAEYGNVSHFINHSCDPNLEVRAVYVDCIDANLPRLGLFAIKKTRAGEEITFDYLCQLVDMNGKRSSSAGSTEVCKCNSKNCRTYLY